MTSLSPGNVPPRVRTIQARLAQAGVDVLISMKPENSFFLSGFNPIIYSHPVIAVVPAEGASCILVHALRDDHARASAWVDDIRLYGAWSTKVTMGPNWLAALQEILKEKGVSEATIGFEGDWLPANLLATFQARFPGARLKDVSDIVQHARLVKDAQQIRDARIAAQLADAGMDAALRALADGASERGVAVAAQNEMNRVWLEQYPDIEVCDFGSLEGGVHNGLWCWCLTGERVLINTDNPSLRVPQAGEIAMILIWANCNGIHAENERSVAVGTLPAERQAAYDAILEIRAKVQPHIRPGVTGAQLYQLARQEYIRLGLERYVPGRIGHGLGLGAHEHPSLDSRSTEVLEPGMLITFEPNIRVPEWGGLQHSDTLLITEDGFEFLTTTPREFLAVPR